MDDTLKRARELLPAIIITVLSMIQALALELFWSRFQDADYLWLGGPAALIGWLQFGLLLLGIVEIWLLYVSLMLRFSWIPSMADTTVPFAIGLLEFAMIDLMGPDTIAPWFVILGLLFGIALTTTRLSLRKARRDPANSWFFSHIPPANWRDHLADSTVVVALLLLGALLWWLEPTTWLTVGSLFYAVLVMAWQLVVTHRYWLPLERAPASQ
jgi:hypothetical protein